MTRHAPVGIVSGSGLDLTGLLDTVTARQPFSAVSGLDHGAVPGHDYAFIHGRCGTCPIVLQQGRRHVYEGLPHADVVRTVDVLHGFGVDTILFTNVVGGLLSDLRPGDLVAVSALTPWPYVAWPGQPRTIPTDFRLPGCHTTGVYYWMHGPCYETRAEITALQCQGAAVVGMSTAPEAARCRELGLRTAVVSCVTNVCGAPQALTHEHVLAVARRASGDLTALIRSVLPVL